MSDQSAQVWSISRRNDHKPNIFNIISQTLKIIYQKIKTQVAEIDVEIGTALDLGSSVVLIFEPRASPDEENTTRVISMTHGELIPPHVWGLYNNQHPLTAVVSDYKAVVSSDCFPVSP